MFLFFGLYSCCFSPIYLIFFFKQKTAYEMRISDWSSDVCSSDLRASPVAAVLKKPNHFQTRNQFWESLMLSKLSRGNTYVLMNRDRRNLVTGLYVLDPNRVKPMIAPDGDRQRVVSGKRASARVDLGGRCIIIKQRYS